MREGVDTFHCCSQERAEALQTFLIHIHFGLTADCKVRLVSKALQCTCSVPTDDPDQLVPTLRAGQVESCQTARVRPVDLQPGVAEQEADQISVAALDSQVEQRLAGLNNIGVPARLLQETHHSSSLPLPAGSKDRLALTHHLQLQTSSELSDCLMS